MWAGGCPRLWPSDAGALILRPKRKAESGHWAAPRPDPPTHRTIFWTLKDRLGLEHTTTPARAFAEFSR
jgi:hypothetical protein